MVRREPGEALVEAVAGGSARGLDVPVPVPYPRQAELLLDLVRLHGCKKSEHERLVLVILENNRVPITIISNMIRYSKV